MVQITMKTKGTPKIAWTYHTDYFTLAQENWKRIQELKHEHDAIQAKFGDHNKVSDEVADQLAAKNDEIGKLALIVLVFCAFTLEAYINDYAINRLSKGYLKNYLDKLELVAKWVVIPRLVNGKQLDPGSRPLQHLAWLVELRNKLAHYKSKELALDQIGMADFLWYEDAERGVTAVKEAVLALERLDRKAKADWVRTEA